MILCWPMSAFDAEFGFIFIGERVRIGRRFGPGRRGIIAGPNIRACPPG